MNIKRSRRNAGTLALVAGLALMALGVMRGEAVEVLHKAVQVCLQCIGIG